MKGDPSTGPARATLPGPDGRVVFDQTQTKGTQFRIPLFTMNPDGTHVWTTGSAQRFQKREGR